MTVPANTEARKDTPERIEYRVGLLLIVFAHVSDLCTTFLRSPDLALEVGDMYVILGRYGLSGWPTLLTLKLVAVLFSAGCFVFYLRERRAFYPTDAGMSFNDFLHYTHGQNPVRRADGRWIAPSMRLLAIWGAFIASIGTAAYACYLAVQNIMNLPFLCRLSEDWAPGVIFMVTAIVFWRTLYVDYQYMTSDS